MAEPRQRANLVIELSSDLVFHSVGNFCPVVFQQITWQKSRPNVVCVPIMRRVAVLPKFIFVLRDTFLPPQLNGSSNRVVTKEGVIPRE